MTSPKAQLKRRLAWLRAPYHRYIRKPAHIALAASMQRMPRDSLSIGPPRRTGTVVDASESGASSDCREIVLPERLVFDEPKSITPHSDYWALVETSPDLGNFPRTATGDRYCDIPPGRVYTLPLARALGAEGWIIDAEDRLLTDLSPDYLRERYTVSRHPIMNQLRLPALQSFSGTVAVLATLSARDFYGHWMMDLLPRAAMIKRAGFRFEDFDGVYLPKPRHHYQVELLTRLGIHVNQIIDADVVPHLRAAKLIVPSCHANVFVASKWCCETLRALVPRPSAESSHSPGLIYVSRSKTAHRRLVNEAELREDVLEPQGFVPIWPEQLTSSQKTAIFSSAKVVVTPLGSSVANLVYCRPGTQIVEIMNPRCVQPCALAIATQLGLGHHVVLAPGVSSTQHEITEDLLVPKWRLERGIEHAMASRAQAETVDGSSSPHRV